MANTERVPQSGQRSELRTVFRSAGGRTEIGDKYHTAPVKIAKAFPVQEQLAVIVMDVSPGMLEGDRYEILDVITRPESPLVGRRFRDLPMTGALIGAVVREGRALFPHGDDVLQAGDRAIVFTESDRAAEVEQAL